MLEVLQQLRGLLVQGLDEVGSNWAIPGKLHRDNQGINDVSNKTTSPKLASVQFL
jgi:hypothetical protein